MNTTQPKISVSGRIARIALTLAAAASVLSPAFADQTVRAVWQVEEIYLPYFGLTTQYTCEGMRDRVRATLAKLGAREDMAVSVGCTEVNGPSNNPTVRMVFAHPVPATDENTKAIAADAKRADLLKVLARSRKQPTDTTEPFDAVQKRVVLLSKDNNYDSSAGNCELLEQMRDRVLKRISATIVTDEMRCTPRQGHVGQLKLEVDVLVPAAK
jgi:hypothetical protein